MYKRLTPRFLEKVWGSTHLEPWFPNSEKKIGEVWFEGANVPLLVKFLYTTGPLSVQVHPEGKTEMWHVLKAEPGAKVSAGFREPISEERLRASSLSGEIENLLESHEARPGDTFFIPAGVVHAIGAGLVLCEIQQYSDVTYRLYDYNRPRELQIEQAIPVSRREPHAARQPAREGVLVTCPFFTTEKLRVDGERRCSPGRMVILLEGSLSIGGQPANAGEAWYIEPGSPPAKLTGQATVLVTRPN